VIYSDFESTTNPDGKQRVNSYCLFCPDLYDLGSSFALMLYCNKDEEDVMSHFCMDLQNMYEAAFNYLEQYKEVPKLTAEQQKNLIKLISALDVRSFSLIIIHNVDTMIIQLVNT
jgi:hypothetical protein